jgi:hypothetical protein
MKLINHDQLLPLDRAHSAIGCFGRSATSVLEELRCDTSSIHDAMGAHHNPCSTCGSRGPGGCPKAGPENQNVAASREEIITVRSAVQESHRMSCFIPLPIQREPISRGREEWMKLQESRVPAMAPWGVCPHFRRQWQSRDMRKVYLEAGCGRRIEGEMCDESS